MNNCDVKILIVDDSPVCREVLREVISEHDYQTDSVDSGQNALEQVKKKSYDLILLDIHMPDMDGFETCLMLKANMASSGIPIIFVTGSSNPQDVAKGFSAGAVDYIQKPIIPSEVLARVDQQINLLEKERLANIVLADVKKMADLGSLVSGIAHEVSSPFGTLKLALNHMRSEIAKTQVKMEDNTLQASYLTRFLLEAGELVASSEKNIDNVTQVLSSFKLIAVDQCNISKSVINLEEYINTILLSLKPKIKITSHKVYCDIPEDVYIQTKPGVFSQIIINLISNSLLHGFADKSNGSINITYQKVADGHVIKYTDDGCGISAKHLDLICHEYFTTKPNSGGTGLGLFIIKNLIESDLNGKMSIESQEGQGVTTTIKLPLKV